MKRAEPVKMREAINLSIAMAKAGILFVPVPVRDAAEQQELLASLYNKLEEMEREASHE